MDGLFPLEFFHQIAGIVQGKNIFLFHLSHLRKIKLKEFVSVTTHIGQVIYKAFGFGGLDLNPPLNSKDFSDRLNNSLGR